MQHRINKIMESIIVDMISPRLNSFLSIIMYMFENSYGYFKKPLGVEDCMCCMAVILRQGSFAID